jgi:ABC-type Co2+ transport system permease subunit
MIEIPFILIILYATYMASKQCFGELIKRFSNEEKILQIEACIAFIFVIFSIAFPISILYFDGWEMALVVFIASYILAIGISIMLDYIFGMFGLHLKTTPILLGRIYLILMLITASLCIYLILNGRVI